MRYFYLFCLSLIHFSTIAQIPNGGFEIWETIENYEVPSLWETNQDTIYSRITKDSISIEGEYSLKLSSDSQTAWFDCSSRVTLSHRLETPIGEGKSFFFNVKVQPDNIDNIGYFSFYCFPYVNGMLQESIKWETSEEYTDFTLIEIPISNPEIDSIFIQIVSGALNGADDGCYNKTNAWVDGLSIENSTTNVINVLQDQINIYPIPTDSKITIEQKGHEYHKYCVFNNLGQEIMHGDLSIPELELPETGIYFIQLISNFSAQRNITRKIIVSK